MYCKRCGKALGTDRGICPFCGAMLSQSQMKTYIEEKKEQMKKPELLTQKYGNNKFQYYEKQKDSNKPLVAILILLGVVLFLIILVVIKVLNS